MLPLLTGQDGVFISASGTLHGFAGGEAAGTHLAVTVICRKFVVLYQLPGHSGKDYRRRRPSRLRLAAMLAQVLRHLIRAVGSRHEHVRDGIILLHAHCVQGLWPEKASAYLR